jgi:RNA polymerase sigma-70 factor (ECF subfamily)
MGGVAQQLGGFPVTASDDTRSARDAAFAALVDRHACLMYRVAFSLLKHREDAEDAVQETFLKLYRTGGWQQMEDEKAFLATSVWRAGLNRLASAGAKAMRHAEDVAEMQLASAELSPEASALGASNRELIAKLIGQLPQDLRQALELSAIEGMQSREVAAILSINEGTVRTRVLRGKTELRRRFLELNAAKGARR